MLSPRFWWLCVFALCITGLLPTPLVSAGPDYEALFELCAPTVVILQSTSGSGSGFFINPTGYIVTNAHVVKGANTVRVITYGGQEYLGKVIDQAVDMDIALVKLDFDNLPVARLGSVLDLKAGTELFALGAPLGFDFTITRGLLSSVSRKVQGREYIQSDLPLNPGNSGGPLFNNRGEVVGVNTLVVKDAQGISLSIPIPAVMDYLDSRGIAYSASLSTNSIRPTSVESHNVHDRGFKYIYVVLPLLVVASGLGIALLIKKKRNPRDKDFNIELK